MAVRALVQVRDWHFNGANLDIQFELIALNGPTQSTTRSVAHANVTATNFEAGLKSQVITYVQNQYGVTLNNDEILLR